MIRHTSFTIVVLYHYVQRVSFSNKLFKIFYATLAYIRHFIFAGCHVNDPWYPVTNLAGHLELAGHLDLAGLNFSKCPANSKQLAFSSDDRLF
jgi:hypothetical protein